jgi:opacity protein-like surface antigen
MKQGYFCGGVALALCLNAFAARAQYYYPPPEYYYPPQYSYYPPEYSYYPPGGAGPCFRFGIGPSFFENGQLTRFGGPTSSGVEYCTGLASEVAFGYAFNRYVATDFEFGFVDADIKHVQAQGFFSQNSYIYNLPFLANVTLSYPIPRSIVVPYIGVGAGGSVVGFDTDGFGNNTDAVYGAEDDVVFAWQAFAGLRFKLKPWMSLGIGYKYFATDDPSFSYPPDNFTVGFKGAKTHSVLFTFEWRF